MKTKSILLTLIIEMVCLNLFSQDETIDYFGQTPPSTTLIKFASGIVATPKYADILTFSPNGDEMFQITQGVLKYSSRVNDEWSTLKDTIVYEGFSPIFAPFKNLIYWSNFNSGNPILKYTVKINGVWSDTIDTHIHGANFVSATLDSNIYFVSYEAGGVCKMYYSKFNGEYHESPISLPFPINDNNTTFKPNDSYISPDGSYMILQNDGGSMGSGVGAFITFKLNNNQWSTPTRVLNSFSPIKNYARVTISPDGKYIFTVGAVNGLFNYYWISTEVIEKLRPLNIHNITTQTDNSLNVFPNPTKDKIKISFGEMSAKNVQIEIFNIDGKQVITDTYKNPESIEIDLTNNSKGVYIVRLSTDYEIVNKVVVLE
jgi:hypothetical protein